jgi:hypothetical protein
MAYGEIKVDTVTFTDGGIDKSVSISGLVQNPTFSGNITVTGTISGNTVQGQTVSGATVTGTTANFVSGVFTTQISGATITGNVGSFTTITGGTVTLTSGVFASGTAAAPSVSIGTTDNGLYSPGTDQVAVATNGTGRLFVDASGNVGVGTSSVNALLEVNNSTAGGEVQRIEGNYDGSGSVTLTNWRRAGGSVAAALKYNDDSSPLCMSIGTTTSHEFRIRTADTDAITIDASQRVGIGTSSPGSFNSFANNLVVGTGTGANGITIYAGNTSTSVLNFADGTSGNDLYPGYIVYNHADDSLSFIVNYAGSASARMFISSAGNVGIGTTTVNNGVLHVKSNGIGSQSGLAVEASANDSFLSITNNGSAHKLEASYNSTGSYQPISFVINGEKARIDTSGRLLVGTSSTFDQSARLQVIADTGTSVAANFYSYGADNSQFVIGAARGTVASPTTLNSNDTIGGVYFRGHDGTSFKTGAQIQAQIDGITPSSDLPSRLVFSTTADGASSPTERLRITSAGLVGIGTSSPDSYKDEAEQLVVAKAGNCGITVASANNGVGALYFADGTSGSDASRGGLYYSHIDNSMQLLADGSARVHITSAGNVGIGTTSPGAKLDVVGNARVRGSATPTLTFNDGAIENNLSITNSAFVLSVPSANPITFNTTNTERLRITSAGFVGIGTSSPSYELQVNAASNAVMSTSNSSSVTSGNRGTIVHLNSDNNTCGMFRFAAVTDNVGTEIQFHTRPAAGLLRPRLGIGTTSPGDFNQVVNAPHLVVGGGTTSSPGLTLYSTTSGTPIIAFADGTAGNQQYRGYLQYDHTNDALISSASSYQRFDIAGSEGMRLDSSKRLLVGTSTILSSAGGVQIYNTSPFLVGCKADNNPTQGAVLMGMEGFSQSGAVFAEAAFVRCESGGSTSSGNHPGQIIFGTTATGTSSTERMRIDSSGRVGIGTSAPASTLHIQHAAQTAGYWEGKGLLIHEDATANQGIAFYSRGDTEQYIASLVDDPTSYLIIGTRKSSSVNAVDAITIRGDGKVGIGTTSPSELLHVAGTIRIGAVPGTDTNGALPVLFQTSAGNIDGGSGLTYNPGGDRLLVGTSTARDNFFNTSGLGGLLQVEGANNNARRVISHVYGVTGPGGPMLALGKHRGNSVGDNTVVQSGDECGLLSFLGSDGTEFVEAAQIRAEIDGTPGANDMPGRLVFSTTADGASVPTGRAQIDNAGRFYTFVAAATDGAAFMSAEGAGTVYQLFAGWRSASSVAGASAQLVFQVFTNGNTQNTNNSYTGISDLKLKENVVDAGSQWSDIKELRVRKYNFKEETGHETHTQIGLIAQEAELVSPGLVIESPDRNAEGKILGTTTKSVNYSVLYMKAVKALQEAMERIETLEAKVAALESA